MNNVFITKPLSVSIIEASVNPVPNMLFSEFWYEGELAILFADTNVGKSILATQIANSICEGIPIEGFKMESKAQEVLLFDFEMTEKQLETRYSESYSSHFSFSPKLKRSSLNMENDLQLTENELVEAIEHEIIKQKAKVVIIDNITYLTQDNEKAKFASSLMKQLKNMKKRHDLSILVLSHTPKRDFSKPLTINDIQGSKMISNFCDSAFTIGNSFLDTSIRYVKQVKQRNCEQIYNADNVCVCTINKGKQNNFLQFVFKEYDSESCHLNNSNNLDRDAKMDEAKRLKAEGLSNVKIAKELGVTEGAVRKWFKL